MGKAAFVTVVVAALFTAHLALATTGSASTGSASAASPSGPGWHARATAKPKQQSVNPNTGTARGALPRRTSNSATPLRRTRQLAASVTPHLNYYNGPVVSGARVRSVLWGGTSTDYLGQVAGTAPAPNMDSFFGHVTNSSYLGWLSEYDTKVAGGSNQHIGYGSFASRTTISPASGSTNITDDDIVNELIEQLNAQHVPEPTVDSTGNPDTVYAVFLPYGTRVCISGSDCSGVTFCAYHSTVGLVDEHDNPLPPLLYMVLPSDQGKDSGCGAGNEWQNVQSFTSHELVEVVTDPDIGIANTLAAPLAWYDPNNDNGEIGDICAGANDQGTVTGTDGLTYTVQKEWSNAFAACILDKGSSAPGAPASPTATPQPAGNIKVGWSAPVSDGGTAVLNYNVYRSGTPGSLGTKVGSVGGSVRTFTDSGLTNASRYYYQVIAHNIVNDGPASAQVSAVTDSTVPHVSLTAPGTLFQISTTVTASYAGADSGSGVGSFDVRYRSAAWNAGFSSYSALANGTTATSRSIVGSPGREYCFSVRVRDRAGNLSGWSSEKCAVVPLDDRSLSAATSGWSRTTSSAAYRGTWTRTTTTGAKLQLSNAHTDRIALIVTQCSTCGSVSIYLNGVLCRTVSTAATTNHYKVILVQPAFSLRVTSIVLRNASSGRKLIIDGLGIART